MTEGGGWGLTTADIERDSDGQVWLRVGDPPAPVPGPFAAMLTGLAASRAPGGWLFPGCNAGQPVACRTMHSHLRDLGLPMRAGRIAAIRQLVLQAPAPVIAGALGFHQTTTTRQVSAAGGTWNRYAGIRRH